MTAAVKPTDAGGLLLVDKPAGPTSFDVVQRVRRALRSRKAGHAGTLDPAATGLLLVAVGEATRLLPFLTMHDKRYVGTVRLGETTDTLDAAGTVLERRPTDHVTAADVAREVQALEAITEQVAPMYSAKRVDGQRLYDLARAGEEVERKPFPVVIHSARLLAFIAPEVTIEVHCSKGTYIRTLSETLGERLGTGAHLSALRRTSSGRFDVRDAIGLEQLETEGEEARRRLLDTAATLAELPVLRLDDRTAIAVSFGNPLEAATARALGLQAGAGASVRLEDGAGRVIAIGAVEPDGAVKLARVLEARVGPGLHKREA